GDDFGPVPTDHDGEYQLWEKRVDAMMRVLSSPTVGLMKVDELRRGIETLGAATYNAEPYYGKWARSLAKIMVEKGVLTRDELDARIAALRAERGLPE
ncbi:MAG: ScnB-like protein, partial [Alphaproteobacteria bacterium]